MKDLAKHREELTHRTFTMMFRVLIIFGIPAAAAFFVGRYLDQTYNMRPWGSLISLGVAFAFSWTAVIRMYLKLDREFRKLREDEEKQEAEGKKEIKIQSPEDRTRN